jgi:hypothetical protein
VLLLRRHRYRAAFQSWVLLRHHERAPAGQLDRLDQALTVSVLLTPRSDGVRDWDTTVIAVSGDPQLTEEELGRFSQSKHLTRRVQ